MGPKHLGEPTLLYKIIYDHLEEKVLYVVSPYGKHQKGTNHLRFLSLTYFLERLTLDLTDVLS
ncbi:hypothetical protein HanRHA438_Chr14g0635831 [Helianthus annuus]|nr:hypothetical protein HanRHA438_Chr14g0635831 [Helianthus annuus]